MEMNGGPCVPLFCTSFDRGGNRSAVRLRGAGGGSFPLYGGTFARSYLVSNKVGLIERGTAKGGTAKMRLWTRVRRNGAFGARAQGKSLYLPVETRHFDTYQNRSGYISQIRINAPALCLEAVPEGHPPGQYPPYHHSS